MPAATCAAAAADRSTFYPQTSIGLLRTLGEKTRYDS